MRLLERDSYPGIHRGDDLGQIRVRKPGELGADGRNEERQREAEQGAEGRRGGEHFVVRDIITVSTTLEGLKLHRYTAETATRKLDEVGEINERYPDLKKTRL